MGSVRTSSRPKHRFFPGIVVIFDEHLRANQRRRPVEAGDARGALV